MNSSDTEGSVQVTAVPRPTQLPDRLPWAAAIVLVAALALGLWLGIILAISALLH